MAVTLESWRAFLQKLEETAIEGAKTKHELSKELGRGSTYTLRWIKTGLDNNWLELVWVTRTRIDGNKARVPAYKLKEEPKVKAKGK